MNRRDFITLLGRAAAISWPLAARAQQPNRVRRIGMLVGLPEGDPEGQRWAQAFLGALEQLGWKRGLNVQIDLRWGANDPELMQRLARELVNSEPDLIQVSSTPATAAVLRETHTIPVVFGVVTDAIGSKFVASLSRPGGNVTGFQIFEENMGGKWVEVLKDVAPRLSRVAVIYNPVTASFTPWYQNSMGAAAAALGATATMYTVKDRHEIETVITTLGQDKNAGLIVTPDIFTGAQAQRDLIVSLAARYRVPVLYTFAHFVRVGGLISYGVDLPDLQRRAATYVDRIFKGAKPQDLPVQQPTRYELVINLKTAKTLGLDLPPTLIARADEVIE